MSPDHVQLVPAHDQDPLRIFYSVKGLWLEANAHIIVLYKWPFRKK